jgi:hypothetical protein
MKKTIITSRWICGLVAATGAAGLLPTAATAEVSDADFNALKAMVQQLSEQVQSLRQTNALVEQTHLQDQQQLQALQAKLAETQQTATDANQKATAAAQAQAQPVPRVPLDEATVNRNFQILGDAEFQYVNADHQNGAFVLADFAPIFLYRGGDNILFEAGFDTTLANNAPNSSGYTTTFNLSFAQLDYVMSDYLTLCFGDLLLPLGTYSERGAGWLNKFPDNPLAVDGLTPGSGIGAELRGALPLGDSGKLFNYSVYGVNGPSSSDGTGNAGALDLGGNVGIRSDGVAANLHGNPSGGGRLAVFLPFKPRYDLELGASGMFGDWDNAGNHLWTAGVVDAALHLGPNFEAKGEYILTRYGSDDLGVHQQQGWFVQAGYKLAGLDLELPLLNNLEVVGRYDKVAFAYDSVNNAFDFNTQRYTLGYIYYFTSALLFEGDYEFIHSNDSSQPDTQLILQISYGF